MLNRLMKRIKRCTGGNTTVLVAMSILPMMGALGLGVDAAQWVLWKRQLHSAADLGALAGARALADSQSVDPAVRRSLGLNKLRTYTVDAIENGPTTGAFKGSTNHVRVVLSAKQSLPFSSLFMATTPLIKVEAVAENASTTPNCIIALDTANTTALSVSGSASVDMNCGMASNAAGSQSLVADGQLVKVEALSAVGSVSGSSYDPAQTKVNNGIAPVADPLAGKLSMPSNLATLCASAGFLSVKSNASATASPMTHGCTTGMTIQGKLTLAPGTYVINGGSVAIGASGQLLGNGVTLIFTNTDPAGAIGKFTGNGSSFAQLSAPTSGPYAGILMYQDPRAAAGKGDFYITGTSGMDASGKVINSSYEGTIYTPSTYATFNGNSAISTPCMQIIASHVIFIGNTTVENNCPPGSGASAYGGGGTVRLVG